MMWSKIVVVGVLFLLLCSFPAEARISESDDPKKAEDSYFFESETDMDMKILIAEQKPFTVSYGGWIESALIDTRYDNDSSPSFTSSLTSAKLWFKIALPFNSYIYLRGRDVLTYCINKPESLEIDSTDNQPDLDAAYLSISILDNSIKLSLGRSYFLSGTGLVFNGRGDGGELALFTKLIDMTLFGAYTGLLNKDTNPYRLSSSNINDKGKRIFAGGELSKSFYNQTLYALVLLQIDKNDSELKYDSKYYGAGLKGVLGNVLYYSEFVYEQGSADISTDTKSNISAMAARAGLNYFLSITTKPAILFDYAFGSGDPDKKVPYSPNGNLSGDDNGFMYFGTYSGGYALRPYLANIHIGSAGLAITPFDGLDPHLLKRINLTAKYFYYRKDKKDSAINNGEASNSSVNIGQEADLSLKWKVFWDLSFYVNYGLFIPGTAYASDEENRSFVMAGIFMSF